MGYTRYWSRTDKPITQDFVDAVNNIITEAKARGITICGWDGTGEPEVTLERISFNGKAPHLDHESCGFDNKPTDFDFCKTAEKPYDWVVKRVLEVGMAMEIVENVSDDGEAEEFNDEQYMEYYEELKRRYSNLYK